MPECTKVESKSTKDVKGSKEEEKNDLVSYQIFSSFMLLFLLFSN